MGKLIAVSGCSNADRAGDVVFVHGLDGNAYSTWHRRGEPDHFWPAWLGEDLPEVGVWSLEYEASSMIWRGQTMPLADRATNILALLEVYDIGRLPLVFVTHSLGGLLVKQMLRHAADFGVVEWQLIAAQTRGIVFLSTPHSGSNIACWLKYVGIVLHSSVTIDELEAHEPRLRELNLWYRNNVQVLGVRTQAYCEKRKVYGILVVDETSADPGIPGVTPVPLDDDHLTICKPESKQSLVYARVKKFVRSCVGVMSTGG